MDLKDLASLAPQYGLAGIAMWFLYKIAGNHIEHSTKALTDLTKVIAELKTWLEARER